MVIPQAMVRAMVSHRVTVTPQAMVMATLLVTVMATQRNRVFVLMKAAEVIVHPPLGPPIAARHGNA